MIGRFCDGCFDLCSDHKRQEENCCWPFSGHSYTDRSSGGTTAASLQKEKKREERKGKERKGKEDVKGRKGARESEEEVKQSGSSRKGRRGERK